MPTEDEIMLVTRTGELVGAWTRLRQDPNIDAEGLPVYFWTAMRRLHEALGLEFDDPGVIR